MHTTFSIFHFGTNESFFHTNPIVVVLTLARQPFNGMLTKYKHISQDYQKIYLAFFISY